MPKSADGQPGHGAEHGDGARGQYPGRGARQAREGRLQDRGSRRGQGPGHRQERAGGGPASLRARAEHDTSLNLYVVGSIYLHFMFLCL